MINLVAPEELSRKPGKSEGVFQVDYIGNKTTHAPMATPLSPAVFVPGVWGPGGTGCAGVVTTGPAGKAAGAAGTPCSTVANQSQRFYLTQQNPLQPNTLSGHKSSAVAGMSSKRQRRMSFRSGGGADRVRSRLRYQ